MISHFVTIFLFTSLCLLPWDSGQLHFDQSPLLQFDFGLKCNASEDCFHIPYSTCVENFCECDPGFEYDILGDNTITCIKCPGIRGSCFNDCCYPPNITECRQNVCRCNNSWNGTYSNVDCSGKMEAFKLATQIALGSALILAVACLLAILWKSCKRRRDIAHQMAGSSSGESASTSRVPRRRLRAPRRSSSQASLTSGQLRVAELLRDRPPSYYDRTHIRIEKPPTYEETVEQPQRFAILNMDASTSLNVQFPVDDGDSAAAADTHEDRLPSYEMVLRGTDNVAFVIDDEKTTDCDPNARNTEPIAELHM